MVCHDDQGRPIAWLCGVLDVLLFPLAICILVLTYALWLPALPYLVWRKVLFEGSQEVRPWA